MQIKPAYGRTWIVLAALGALAACGTNTTTSNASDGGMRMAGAASGSGAGNSVGNVSNALGQRLDGMLNTASGNTGASR